MGYCVRCGELASGSKCLQCRGRSVVSIATALDSIGHGANASLEGGWESRANGPSPKASSSTPIGAMIPKQNSPVFERRPLSRSPRPATNRQGAISCDTDKGRSASTDKESVISSPTSPISPLISANGIHTARSGLSKGSTRNSSFFLNAMEKATPATLANDSKTSARNILASYSTSSTTSRLRPKLTSQLFFHEMASSAVNSPVSPNSPTTINWPIVSQQDVPLQNDAPQDYAQNLKEESRAPSRQAVLPKKKRTCCKCNEPLRRTGKGPPRRIGVPPAAGTQDDYAWYHYECLTCPVCEGHFTEQDYFIRHGTNVYHLNCRTSMRKNEIKDSIKCATCSKPTILGSKGDGFQHENMPYHFECAFICYTCQTLVVSPEPRKEFDGKMYCMKCSPSISPPVPTPRRRRCVSSGAIALTSTTSGNSSDITSPSDLFRHRRTALPKLGGPTICPRCNQSTSIMDVTRGPRATSWHKKCLVCANPTCKKRMDGDANVYISESGQWLVYCRCCTDKNRRRSTHLQ